MTFTGTTTPFSTPATLVDSTNTAQSGEVFVDTDGTFGAFDADGWLVPLSLIDTEFTLYGDTARTWVDGEEIAVSALAAAQLSYRYGIVVWADYRHEGLLPYHGE
ncbi:MAG TPA: hypothetical protein VK507_19165 [Iamia sp.]|nr:hypothetical protein [Iamia sp.]